MQAGPAHSSSSHDDALFQLLQAVNPGKKLKKEDIPLDKVRAYLVEEIVRRATTPNQKVRYVPKLRDGAPPHKELVLYRLERPLHGLDQKEKEFFKSIKISMLPKPEARLIKLRQKRRAQFQSSAFFRLECDERYIASTFARNYESLIVHKQHPSVCLRIILNTLSEYFSRRTWSTNIKRTVAEFLRQCVLKSCSDLGSSGSAENRKIPLEFLQLEAELACLIEIYLLDMFPKDSVHDTDIFAKLNLIHHIFDGDTLKNVLNETLCDEFAHTHGRALTEIFEWFNLPIPADLLKYESEAHKISSDWGFEESLKKPHVEKDHNSMEETNGNPPSQASSAPVTRRTSHSSTSGDDADDSPVETPPKPKKIPKIERESVAASSIEDEDPSDEEVGPSPPKCARRTRSPGNKASHGSWTSPAMPSSAVNSVKIRRRALRRRGSAKTLPAPSPKIRKRKRARAYY